MTNETAEPTYTSTQATNCAGCGEHKHTPLRIDAMGGYVCLTCIDQKLGELLGEFGHPEPVEVPLTALHLIEDAAQAHDQCRAVVHMALSLAEVYVARAAILSSSISAPVELIGQSSAATMEYLGDLLSNMDAVEEEDEWLEPIFEAAQTRWPTPSPL